MRKLGLAPSAKLRRHFLALARRVRQWYGSQQRPARIGVTSLKASAGRSTVAFNLAASLTRISSDQVLLVESDFGRHFVSRRLGIAGSVGLSDIVLRQAAPSQCVVDSPIEKFSVMPSGSVDDQDALELPFERLEALLETEFERFGFLIFDLPVASELSACYSIVPSLDGVILIVDNDKMDRNEVLNCKQRINGCGTELIGVVVNRKN